MSACRSGSGRVLWWWWWGLVVVTLVEQTQAGTITKIYTPDNIHEIREDIANKKCREDPNCVLPQNPTQRHRCKVGGGMKEIMEETRMGVTTRTGAAAAGGGGGGTGCNMVAGEIVWPKTGECVRLLTQGPCAPGEWVKLNKTNFKPVCQPQPCTLPSTPGGDVRLGEGPGVMVRGKCYPPSQLPRTLKCPPSQKAITNEHGELECDCEPGYVFYEGDGICYKPYTRGPCAPGYFIQVEDNEAIGRVRCVSNPCPADGMVRMDKSSCQVEKRSNTLTNPNAHCFSIGTQGPCDAGTITIDSNLAEPICLTTHTILDRPLTCSRGSIRDFSGRCRSIYDTYLDRVPLFATERPGRRGCPPGTYFATTCIDLNG